LTLLVFIVILGMVWAATDAPDAGRAYIFATVLAVSAFGYSTSNTWIGDTSRLWIAAVVLALIGLHKSYNRNRNRK
jgi:hypothetical protein